MAVKLGWLESAKYGFSVHLSPVDTQSKQKKALKVALDRVRKWCGLRDRSEREAMAKFQEVLRKMDPSPSSSEADSWVANGMDLLLAEGFVDDARCAESYTRVHLEHKSWGPLKIRAGLSARGVASQHIDRAIANFDETRWQAAANALLSRRAEDLEAHRERVLRWLMQRGFPQRMVLRALKEASDP
jgi:SOS response regulatory protein OraA/RecX